MREIEFRGQTGDGRWIYGSLVYSESIQPAIYFEVGQGEVKTMDWAYVKPTSVGQFTGLRDKNGKRIYEGDVVQSTYGLIFTGVVVWNEDVTAYALCIDGLTGCYALGEWENERGAHLEVIGNIHDNPELIKQ